MGNHAIGHGGTMKPIVIYGASGHGKVIADIIEKSGGTVMAFVDDDSTMWGQPFFDKPLWDGMNELIKLHKTSGVEFSVIVAIGKNDVRLTVAEKLKAAGLSLGTAIHPSAQIGKDVKIGEGTVVMAGAVINPGSRVGSFCIVNTASTIDHDCVVADYVHLSPGSHLGGTVQIGRDSWVGVGASVINNISIGEQVIIGAGAVVIRDVDDYSVVVGNPATLLRKTTPKEKINE